MRAISLAKFEEGIINEDAALVKKEVIAVSDGAGGGGVFADLWSKFLVGHLSDKPIKSFKAFDKWIDGIWEPFYNDCEEMAKTEGGIFLNKFYDEGSFATLATVWEDGQWMSYGDSVAFCYDIITGRLQHSFGKIVDFNNPPYLINCKDLLDEKGFRCGKFRITTDCIVFAASDALAHYILMMYEVAHKDVYADELQEAIAAQTKNSNFIKTAMSLPSIDFDADVIRKLLNCNRDFLLGNHIKGLRKKGLIGHDDYSLAMF